MIADEGKEMTQEKEIITYCRIGERSYTWFVLNIYLDILTSRTMMVHGQNGAV